MAERRLTTRDLATRPDDAGGDPEEVSPAGGQSSSAVTSEPADAARNVETSEQREPLLPLDQTERFTARWREIQTSFVDRPRDSVEQADVLVADLMQRLAASFSNERERLEKQWDGGDDVSTEDLRVALTRYRSFFDRLLSA